MGVEGETHTIHLVPRRPRITVKVKMLSGKVMDVKAPHTHGKRPQLLSDRIKRERKGVQDYSLWRFGGCTVQPEVDRNETVGGLMSKIEAQEGYPVDQQRLIFNGTKLEDRFASLTDKKVDASPTVHL
eukprot:784331-Amphidinium_carterae.1